MKFLRRIRFSLCTLLLFVLLIGSGMLLWRNREPWQNVLTLQSAEGRIVDANFSKNGSKIVTVTETQRGSERGRETIVWDSQTGAKLLGVPSMRFHWHISVLSPGDRWLHVPGCEYANLFDAKTGECVLGADQTVGRLMFSTNGLRLLVFYKDEEVEAWDAVTLKPLARLQGAAVGPRELFPCLTNDGTRAFYRCRLWNCDTGKPLFEAPRCDDGEVRAAFSPDGQWAIIGSYHFPDNTPPSAVFVVNVNDGSVVAQTEGWMHLEAFSPDSQWAPVCTATGTVLYDVSGRRFTPLLSERVAEPAAFSPDSRRLITLSFQKSANGSRDYTGVTLWDMQSGRQIAHADHAFGTSVYRTLWRPDCITILAYRDAWVWNPQTGKQHSLPGDPHLRSYSGILLTSPDKDLGRDSEACRISVWDVDTGKCQGELAGNLHGYQGDFWPAMSPDATHIITKFGSSSLRVWQRHHDLGVVGLLKTFELWLFIVPLVLFLWSVWRDRKTL